MEEKRKTEEISIVIERLRKNKEFIRDIAKVLSEEEREYIKEGLLGKQCLNCDKENTCKVKTPKYDCPQWDNDYFVGIAKVFNIKKIVEE